MNARLRSATVLVLSVAVLVVIVIVTRQQIDAYNNRPVPQRPPEIESVSVATVSVETGTYRARISGYGAARSRFELELAADVGGKVLEISEALESGMQVKAGETLVRLEDSSYRAAVAAAAETLASRRLELLEEQRQGQQALAEWQASGLAGEPDSDLVLRKPQLAAAEAAVRSAEQALAEARQQLDYTRIKAPFDAVVITRSVTPGSTVAAGGVVAMLYSTDRLEIALSLSSREWASLPDEQTLLAGDWPVQLQRVDGEGTWQGRVIRIARHRDDATRQRSLIVAVENPLDTTPALLPGSFVSLTLAGEAVSGLWQLPATALSQRGEIWYLTAAGTLDRFAATPLFSDSQYLYLRPPEALAGGQQQIITRPLSSYLQGMRAVSDSQRTAARQRSSSPDSESDKPGERS